MTFGDGLRESFEQMMAYREAAGYATDTYRSSIPPFIEHCADNYPDSTAVTRKMVDGWLAEHPYSANSRAVFISLLREYTKYLRFLGRDDFIPDDEYPTKRIAFHPYLFTDEELRRLFTAFDSCTGATRGKRYLPEAVLPVYSRFLFCCGMRPQEPPALLCRDVDLSTGDIYIRQSKRHKDRHIMMSDDMLELCRRYNALAGGRNWFFQRWDGRPYSTSWYNQVWRRIWKKVGSPGGRVPRPYDLRHAFASRNIVRWIGTGRDVMELLPYLSAYMGHSELTSTLYYVHMLPEKLRTTTGIDWEFLSSIYGGEAAENED